MKGSVFGSGGGSVITQPVGGVGKATVIQRALEAFRRIVFSADDLKDPARLYQVLYQLVQSTSLALRILGENPIGGGNVVAGLIFTAGQTQYVQHGLGHDYRGWFCVRAQTNPASLTEAALPAAATKTQVLPVTSANAGTYDLYVF